MRVCVLNDTIECDKIFFRCDARIRLILEWSHTMARNFSSNLCGKVRNFSLPKEKPLIPLFETIVNAINAIDERKLHEGDFVGSVCIQIKRSQTIFSENDTNTISGFSVKDNGIGFDENNMRSFMIADTDHKLNIGGKGVGRFSWLKAFEIVRIESVYKDDQNLFRKRNFSFSLKSDLIDDSTTTTTATEQGTTVSLDGFLETFEQRAPKDINVIASKIIQHCFAYFLKSDCPKISISDDLSVLCLNDLFSNWVKSDQNLKNFSLGGQNFQLLSLKISERSFSEKNKLFFCANERLVCSETLSKTIVNLDSNIFDQKNYWYVGILTSSYFDENVDMNRLSINIPKTTDPIFPNTPGFDDIVIETSKIVSEYLEDYLSEVAEKKRKRIQKYTTDSAPQYRHLLHYVPNEIDLIKPNLSDEDLEKALYNIKQDFERKAKTECKELLNKLESGNISSEEYQNQFKKTIEKVSDVNRSALADYVVRRRIILDLFDRGLNIKEDGKFNLEKYMHQLIYPMRSSSDDTLYDNHNLWLLDEKLSFCQFISSDKPFDNNNKEDRTDIMCLDSPVALVDSQEKGMAFNSIIIFELKKPMRDDYTMTENPIIQLQNYARRIKEGKAKDCNHRKINVTDKTQFYLYAICDITSSLEVVLDNMNYTKTSDGLGAYFYHNKLNAYIEVLSYDKIRNDAEQRNKILFKKLGI